MSWGWTHHCGMALANATRFTMPVGDFEVRETVWLNNNYRPPLVAIIGSAISGNPAFSNYSSTVDPRLDAPQVFRERTPQ